jgi:hypothetical protein
MIQKSPKISDALCGKIISRCRSMAPMEVRRNAPGAIDEEDVQPHHLPPVYPDQRRRSNPIVIPVTDLDHAFLHSHPEEEKKQLYRMYTRALHVMCNNDVELIQAALRGVIEYISENQ